MDEHWRRPILAVSVLILMDYLPKSKKSSGCVRAKRCFSPHSNGLLAEANRDRPLTIVFWLVSVLILMDYLPKFKFERI